MPASGTAVPGGLGGIRLLTPAERERQKADITREEAVQRSAEEAQIKEGTTAYENAHPKPQTEPFLFKQNVDLFTQQHGRKPTTEETKKIGLDTHQQWTTSGRAPKPTLGPGAEDERTKQVLSRKGIDWEKATPEQIAQGRQQAAKELQAIEKQQLENQRLAAQAKQENLGINAGVSPTGHALPDVQLQADGRPDPTQQTTYLKAFPPEMARTIKALAEYRQSPTSITSRSAGGMNRQRILSYVQGYDPTYNDAMYDVRRRVITDWTSGKTRDAMRAANTVVGHLRDLNDAIKTLAPYKSSWFPGVQNKPRLALLKQTDPTVRDAIRQFDTARQAIAGELTTVYRGTGQGSNKDIEEWEKNADVNAATDDARQFVQTASDLMFSRINAAVSGYQASMGKLPDPGEALTPASVQQMQKLGIDISSLAVHPEAGAAAPASDQNPFRPKGGA